MKKNLYVMAIMMALLPIACTKRDGLDDINGQEVLHEKQYVYNLHLEATIQDFDGHITRATSFTWPDRSRVYLTFFTWKSSGSGTLHHYKSINGTATYNRNSDAWTVITTTALPSIQEMYDCNAYYFENMEKELSSYKFTLDETTPSYSGRGSYHYDQGGDISVSVVLKPSLWRLRFRGTPGMNIQLGSKNIALSGTFEMLNEHVVGGSNDLPFSEPYMNNLDSLNYSLSVGQDGYTPYVYGNFHSGYDYSSNLKDNILQVTTDGIYQRTINGSDLLPGESGVMEVPTRDNYESEEWTLLSSPNTELWPDYEAALGKTYDEIVTLYGSPLVYEDNVMGYYMHNDYINVVAFRLKDGKAWIVQLSVLDGVSETTINNFLRSKWQSYRNGTDNEGDRYFSYINAETIENASIGISYYPDSKIVVYQDLRRSTPSAPGEDDNYTPVTP